MTFVSPRFDKRVKMHLLANFMQSPLPGTPLILAIHGEPGTGKSYQLDSILLSEKVYYRTISSSDLESENANDPAKLVRRTYIEVADEVAQNGYAAGAVVINDIDTALGDWGALVQTTVNRQLVIGELQHISDYPSSASNRSNLRIPIFLTANDLTKIYGPLLRPGRTAIFHWRPDQEELVAMLSPLLPHLSRRDVLVFVTMVNSPAISMYVDIMRDAMNDRMSSLADDFSSNIARARFGELDGISPPSLRDLTEAFERLTVEGALMSDYTTIRKVKVDLNTDIHQDVLSDWPTTEQRPQRARRFRLVERLNPLPGRRRSGQRE